MDYDKQAWEDNTPNNYSQHMRMTIIPADNNLSGFSNSTDTWPLGDLDSLTNNSIPAARVYTGTYMNKPITAMRIDEEAGLASFWYMKEPEPPMRGDLNLDGEVNIADVTVLIDCLLSDQVDPEMFNRADIDGDHEVAISDVTALIDLLLTM